jgi:hypothetical protein
LCRTEKKERKDRKSYGKNPPPHFLLFENPKRLKKEKKKFQSFWFGNTISGGWPCWKLYYFIFLFREETKECCMRNEGGQSLEINCC